MVRVGASRKQCEALRNKHPSICTRMLVVIFTVILLVNFFLRTLAMFFWNAPYMHFHARDWKMNVSHVGNDPNNKGYE